MKKSARNLPDHVMLPIDLFKEPCYLLAVSRKVNGFRKPTTLVAALKPI